MAGLPERVKGRLIFWLGLIALSALYCFYYFYFINGLAFEIALRARHSVKFFFILVAYGIGLLALPRNATGWMMTIWHVVYGVGLLLLVLTGIYDWGIARAPLGIRIVAGDLQELLVSPILYCVIGLLHRSMDRFQLPRKGL